MDKLKKSVCNKDVELLSEEVQEVMNRIPSAIVRWGMTVMAIIVGGLLMASAYIKWPKTIECPFEGEKIEGDVVLKTALSSEALNYLLHRDKQRICIYSPIFEHQHSSDGVTGYLTNISTFSHSNDRYNTNLTVVLNHNKIITDSIFYGDVQFIISEKTLLQSIIGGLKRW